MTKQNHSYTDDVAQQIRSMIEPSKLPDKGLDDLFNSYAILALSKGIKVTNEDVHNAWSVWASNYDPNNKSLIPYDELDKSTQKQDTIFTDAIKSVAKNL